MTNPPMTPQHAPHDSASWTCYCELVEQSNRARAAGRHVEAQRYASAAHKWSMDESIRLQRLGQALQARQDAHSQLASAWDKDRSCTTVDELVARHPELRRLVNACVEADARAQLFAAVPEVPTVGPLPEAPTPRSWRVSPRDQSTL